MCMLPYCRLWPAHLYNIFPNYLIIDTIFEKTFIAYNMCFFIFSKALSEIFLILIRTERDMFKYVVWSSCKVSVILVGF